MARDHRESESVLTHSEEAQLSRFTQKLEEGDGQKQKKKKMHKHVTSLDEEAHHKAPECTEKSQRDRFVQNKVTFMHNSFLDLLYKKKGQNEAFFFSSFLSDNKRHVSEFDMLV